MAALPLALRRVASALTAQLDLFKGLSASQIAKISQLIGGTAALLAGGGALDVNQGAAIAQSAALNNYLTHKQWGDFIAALQSCGSDSACKQRAQDQYYKISLDQEHALALCGNNLACMAPHLQELMTVQKNSETIVAQLKAIGGTSVFDNRIWVGLNGFAVDGTRGCCLA